MKFANSHHGTTHCKCRSREGAWIEIRQNAKTQAETEGRSREGAWIEMMLLISLVVNVLAVVWNVPVNGLSVVCMKLVCIRAIVS